MKIVRFKLFFPIVELTVFPPSGILFSTFGNLEEDTQYTPKKWCVYKAQASLLLVGYLKS